MVKDGAVWTSSGQYCLNGITRGKVLAVCRATGIPALEKNFSLTDVYDADGRLSRAPLERSPPWRSMAAASATERAPAPSTRLGELYSADIKASVAAAGNR